MRKNFGAKAWTYPQPVFILGTYDENGVPDAMNAAWGGISDDQELSLCISAGHKTTRNILARKAFTVSMADEMCIRDSFTAFQKAGALPEQQRFPRFFNTFQAKFAGKAGRVGLSGGNHHQGNPKPVILQLGKFGDNQLRHSNAVSKIFTQPIRHTTPPFIFRRI